ncbi:MAG: hypothetical protein WD072_02755 [Pirellulales bacterium]
MNSAAHRLGSRDGSAGACQHAARVVCHERHEWAAYKALCADHSDQGRLTHG